MNIGREAELYTTAVHIVTHTPIKSYRSIVYVHKAIVVIAERRLALGVFFNNFKTFLSVHSNGSQSSQS